MWYVRIFTIACIFTLSAVALVHVYLDPIWRLSFHNFLPLPLPSDFAEYTPLPRRCGGVLDSASVGHWVQRRLSPKEEKDMDHFMRDALGQQSVPASMQRKDGRCGDITYLKAPLLRALCDPKGRTPCCHQNRCVNLPVDNCTCSGCFDLRNRIYAEHSRWVTSQSECQFRNFSQQEACLVSRDSTFFFVGDSFMRHVYTAAMILFSGNPKDGAMKTGVSKEVHGNCTGLYMFTEKLCRTQLRGGSGFCNNTLNLHLLYWAFVRYGARLAGTVRAHLHRPNHFFFVGMGSHERNNATKVFHAYLKPALDILNSTRAAWPKLVWLGTHATGLFKSPYARVLSQHDEGIRRFTRVLRERLKPYRVPVLDAFNFSTGVYSFDGTHFGMGLNLLKMQILVNYVAEVRSAQ